MASNRDGDTIEFPAAEETTPPSGVKGRVKAAADAAGDAIEGARETVTGAYEAAREKTSAAYEAARDKAAEARRRAGEGVEENPIAALVGGLALGAIAAALIPRTDREVQALGKIGGKINDAAWGAARAARDAGKMKLGELGLDQAKDTARKFFDEAVSAAGSVGEAAISGGKGGSPE